MPCKFGRAKGAEISLDKLPDRRGQGFIPHPHGPPAAVQGGGRSKGRTASC